LARRWRGLAARAFTEFDGLHRKRFRERAQQFKSPMATSFITRAIFAILAGSAENYAPLRPKSLGRIREESYDVAPHCEEYPFRSATKPTNHIRELQK
jgi:hypothetical protein